MRKTPDRVYSCLCVLFNLKPLGVGTMRESLGENEAPGIAPTNNEIEILPGIYERRHFVRNSLGALATIALVNAFPNRMFAPALASSHVPTADKLTWQDFLKQAVPVAQQLIADSNFSFDEYLYRIGS